MKISDKTIPFLTGLQKNNNKEWFLSNKHTYDEIRTAFEEFVQQLIYGIQKFDSNISGIEAKKCVFRIYRDTRFSKDKTPYKTNIGAYISAGGKNIETAGYYIHIQPHECFLAGGAYMPQSNWLKAIRQEISYEGAEFENIVNNSSFKKHFTKLDGDKLKKLPQGYSENNPYIEWIKYKSFIAMHSFSDKIIHSDSFLEYCLEKFYAMFPLNTFLNRAIPTHS